MMGNLNNSSFNALSCLRDNNRLMAARLKFIRPYSTVLSKGGPYLITEFVNKYDYDCFYILVIHSKKHKLGESVNLSFTVNLHDPELIKILSKFLAGGVIVKRKDYFNFTVKNLASISEKVIPFFSKYNLQGKKLEAFNLWKQAADLMSRKAHTTTEGLNDIKKLKLLMHNRVISEETSLVLYGSNLSSTVGSPRYTYNERALVKIPFNKRSIFVGIILSDATLQRLDKGGGARLQFKQKYGQFEYFYLVFFQLSHYCSRGPYVTKTILHKKVHYGLGFTTRSLSCITELYKLFYLAPTSDMVTGEGKKIVPKNLYELLTWEALAHWVWQKSNIKSDYAGYYLNGKGLNKVYGLYINVEVYTIKDIVLLMNVLMIRFRLDCSLHRLKQNKSHIYIKNKSMPLLLSGTRPHISLLSSKLSVDSARGVHTPSKVVPAMSYANADLDKLQIIKENKGKPGIYRWVNLVNNKSYVGSSVNLERRMREYFNISFLETQIKTSNSYIYRSLLKYGYSNFSLDILEYCDPDKKQLINREQYYLDKLEPDYNLLKQAGSLLGFKHTEETIAKFKARTRTEQQKTKHLELLKSLHKKQSVSIEVLDLERGITTIYSSINELARFLGCSSPGTISSYFSRNTKKPFRGRYVMKKLDNARGPG